MKDIDFDELDKAVSSLMGTVTGMPEPAKQDDIKTLTITETIKDGEAPVMPVGEVKGDDIAVVSVKKAPAPEADTPKPAASAPSRDASAAPTPSLAARRSGRFMDMVHPASAMKRTEGRPVSRQGVTVAPLATPAPEEKETVAASAPAPVVEPVKTVVESVEETVEVSVESSPWPDPIDLHEASSSTLAEPEPTEPLENDQSAVTAPLTSPFLSDAKVEKRPLGAPAAAPSDPSTPLAFDTEPATEPAPQAGDDVSEPEQVDIILPEELRGDLIAIEADQSTGNDAATPAVERPASQPVVPTRSMAAPVSMAAAAASTVGGSIPQQYQEQPNTGDQTTGAIYDTASYHQPLEHPAKKQASWLWVVWVVGLLLLGAGAGALVYHFLLK